MDLNDNNDVSVNNERKSHIESLCKTYIRLNEDLAKKREEVKEINAQKNDLKDSIIDVMRQLDVGVITHNGARFAMSSRLVKKAVTLKRVKNAFEEKYGCNNCEEIYTSLKEESEKDAEKRVVLRFSKPKNKEED